MSEKTLTGVVMSEEVELSLGDVCRACSRSEDWVVELVYEGILDPRGNRDSWRFSATSLARAQAAMRLQRDLEIELAGVALALDMMDEIRQLRQRLRRLETGSPAVPEDVV